MDDRKRCTEQIAEGLAEFKEELREAAQRSQEAAERYERELEEEEAAQQQYVAGIYYGDIGRQIA